MRRELLLGCGSNRNKKMYSKVENNKNWDGLITLDFNKDHDPDVVWDLTSPFSLPFPNNNFDEIHAYEVLEHIASQGDYVTFFRQFSDYYRILKPGGKFYATVPSPKSIWAWGDPSHTRIFHPMYLNFLNQKEYTRQVGHTPMSDFRYLYKADYDVVYAFDDEQSFQFVLQAVKPTRIQEGY